MCILAFWVSRQLVQLFRILLMTCWAVDAEVVFEACTMY
jgi:hypothetical protein